MGAKHCTVFTGKSPGDRCRKQGPLTRVETRVGSVTVSTHKVCPECRERMGLPDHDVILESTPDELAEIRRRILSRREMNQEEE